MSPTSDTPYDFALLQTAYHQGQIANDTTNQIPIKNSSAEEKIFNSGTLPVAESTRMKMPFWRTWKGKAIMIGISILVVVCVIVGVVVDKVVQRDDADHHPQESDSSESTALPDVSIGPKGDEVPLTTTGDIYK
ncbi:hypothetical protein AX16_007337 [Volvariella volvacea WC 439]|nr:hypothetical protein AX16_007337 [Volvariella volvacea WC 439]